MFTLKKEHKVTPEDLQIEHNYTREEGVQGLIAQENKSINK